MFTWGKNDTLFKDREPQKSSPIWKCPPPPKDFPQLKFIANNLKRFSTPDLIVRLYSSWHFFLAHRSHSHGSIIVVTKITRRLCLGTFTCVSFVPMTFLLQSFRGGEIVWIEENLRRISLVSHSAFRSPQSAVRSPHSSYSTETFRRHFLAIIFVSQPRFCYEAVCIYKSL